MADLIYSWYSSNKNATQKATLVSLSALLNSVNEISDRIKHIGATIPPRPASSKDRDISVISSRAIKELIKPPEYYPKNFDNNVLASNLNIVELNEDNFFQFEGKGLYWDGHFYGKDLKPNLDLVLSNNLSVILGNPGSGKTTLLRLLLREFNIKSGNILLNNRDIADYSLSDLRKLIGYVPQDQVLFAMSIKENIRFANPQINDKKVEEITKICGLYDDIMAMPEKFDTIVGEKGVSLSGGQKQRLAMSRALIINPEILILDDSLSAVDAKTEHIILENLKEKRRGQTNIITAHRLSAVVEADLIIVLGEDTIIEKGTHDELIENNGWYKETYESQQMEESLKGGSEDVEK